MCRVKAIASSVERLLLYANCSGSSEAGSTEQMCSLTSFSKHLLKMGVRATGLQSFKHVILFFFGMGTMVAIPKVSPLYGIHRYTQFYSIFYSIFFQINNVHNNYSFYV